MFTIVFFFSINDTKNVDINIMRFVLAWAVKKSIFSNLVLKGVGGAEVEWLARFGYGAESRRTERNNLVKLTNS